MKIGFGLYNHMLNDTYYKLAKQLEASHIVAHLKDYFHQSETGSKDQLLGNIGSVMSCGTPVRMLF